MAEDCINFPKLIDCSVETGVVTFDLEQNNPKEKFASCSLEFNELNGDISHTNFLIDYDTLFNLNYQLKSMLNQVDQTINSFNN